MTAAPRRPAEWAWLGRARFGPVARLQEELRQGILAGTRPETLLLCEHDPVITMGRSARPEHLLAPEAWLRAQGIEVSPASRGGDVTYHGPGQLVGYPIFRLTRGVLAHVEGMARAIIEVLRRLDIEAAWSRERPGVWVAGEKICSFGVHVRHRVAIHGFAMNVSTPLEAFAAIVPCGLAGVAITSIAKLKGHAPPVDEVAKWTARAFEEAFDVRLVARSPLQIETAAL